MDSYISVLKEFRDLLSIDDWQPSIAYKREYERICKFVTPIFYTKLQKQELLRITIAEKLEVYKSNIQEIFDTCASNSIFFNSIEKTIIIEAINNHNIAPFIDIMIKKDVQYEDAIKYLSFPFLQFEETLLYLKQVLNSDKKKEDIITAIFSKYIYHLFPVEGLHLFYSQASYYSKSYYDFLKKEYPSKYERSNTLSFVHITNILIEKYNNYNEFISSICSFIEHQYNVLQNHSYFSVMIDDIQDSNNESIQWRLYSDIVLFAEKFIEENTRLGYFHPEKIEQQTKNYIHDLNVIDCKFNISNGGFTYKDCIIISNDNKIDKNELNSKYAILVLFQKNKRDEDIVPCPTCRSYNVRGNSYPTIGVKSWECHNIYCPEKSKYNRGKRFSFLQILKQEAITNTNSQIPKHIFDEWKLDVVSRKNINEIIEYLICEYSFYGDTISLYNVNISDNIIKGRVLLKKEFCETPSKEILQFYNSCFFKRFLIENNDDCGIEINNIGINNHEVYNDDCKRVLASLQIDSIDGAVTSPPYYNAREYSHWDNIYCYLYDMYNHARLLYRVLKPGAYYLFNIFDYFDNENNVVFSLMGKKRMILGAYIIFLFRHIGFELQQNTIWYKGHIQGHRSANQGNFSPYYQSPLNCYEHIFCFRKPSSGDKTYIKFPSILKSHPVVKIIKGINKLGHTAPFPESIPDLLCRNIKEGKILDCYSGSFTTARVAEKYNLRSISIEQNKEYCELGIRLLCNTITQSKLPL